MTDPINLEAFVLRQTQEIRLLRIVVLLELAELEVDNLCASPGAPIVGRELYGIGKELGAMYAKCATWLDHVREGSS